MRRWVLSFPVQRFCDLFRLSFHESFIENERHSAQQFSAEILRDTSKNPRQKHCAPGKDFTF